MTPLESADAAIACLKTGLCPKLDLGGLYARNPTAHKWKAPYRSFQLREVVYWRMLDLLDQSLSLHKSDHALGARILLRSALETLAILIYVNQSMEKVLDGKTDYHVFSTKTEALVLGSKDGSTPFAAMSILTVLDGCEKKYAGIKSLYERLCESAHPNYEGMSMGYTAIDHENHVVEFKNRWTEMCAATLPDHIMTCIEIFTHEYDKVWREAFEKLEAWIEANDEMLETTKPAPAKG